MSSVCGHFQCYFAFIVAHDATPYWSRCWHDLAQWDQLNLMRQCRRCVGMCHNTSIRPILLCYCDGCAVRARIPFVFTDISPCQINPQGSGWAIHGHMIKGGVDVSEFAEWWLVEDAVDAASRFVMETFPGAAIVERHGQHIRYDLVACHMSL